MTVVDLQQQFSGTLIEPGDPEYEKQRSVLMRKGTPVLIAMAQSAKDVAAALAYARDAYLEISIRSGGHANTGLSTNDGGIIIDVSRMNNVELIDKASGRIKIGAGAQWGDIARRLYDWGLALSSGDTKSVGASGLMLGGGIGWMVRKYGLTIDSLVRAEIVTADGILVAADSNTNPDLFWAIRGGGGNFGVLISMECIAHPVRDIFFGAIVYDVAEAATVAKKWRDYMRIAPEALTTSLLLGGANVMGEHPAMCMIQCCWAGDNKADMEAAIAPLRNIGKVLNVDITKRPCYDVLEEAHPPKGLRIETNNAMFNNLTDAKLDQIIHACLQDGRIAQIRSLGGAMSRVPHDATAFAHREAEVMIVMPTFMPAKATDAEAKAFLRPWRIIAEDADGAYANFFSQATNRERNAAYPPTTYKRLVSVKTHYDPTNIFDHNLNVTP